MSPSVVLFFLLSVNFVSGNNFLNDKLRQNYQNYRNEGFMDRIKMNGIKIAKEFLGSESIATKVAEFVVKAFQTTSRNTKSSQYTTTKMPYQLNEPYTNDKIDEDKYLNENQPYGYQTQSPFSAMKHIVKLFGLQPSQISAVAINALLFVAQMISTFFSGPKLPSRPYRSEDMTSWIIDKKSSTLQELILEAKNESLLQTIDNILKQQGNDEETSCIRLLVCKISPFITKMQEVVFGGSREKDRSGFKNMIQRYLPDGDEIKEKGHTCEREFRDCNLDEV